MSYFPCDEGLYKKKYLNDAECGHISGMEMVVDDVIPSSCDEYLDIVDELGNGGSLEGFFEVLELPEEIIKDIRGVPQASLKALMKSIAVNVTGYIMSDIECERGEALVSFIDDKYAGKTDEELKPFWDMSSKDEYTDCDAENDEAYTWNANGKPRPVWNRDNSWQLSAEQAEE